MRKFLTALGLAAVALAGCHNWPSLRTHDPVQQARGPVETPDAAALVRAVNDNASRLVSLQAADVDILAKEGAQPIGLTGVMSCMKPRNFRLQANVFGSQAVDMGSNDREFWYWISKADPPYLVHCSYQDLAKGGVYLPFPFQPDWVLEALGMAEYNPQGNYRVQADRNVVQLIEQTTSSQGQPVQKVTVFSLTAAPQGRPQVLGHILRDANGKAICSARILDVRYDQASGAVVPHRVTLSWPAQRIEMKLTLDSVRVNALNDQARVAALFTRPRLANVPTIDLAQMPAQPTSQIRRVRGSMR
ncbi:MAG TPA: hypothetical protein VJ739_01800 [Gemmataceae bacterium]|nr:hypothetical protein [Gemmataceae bacterium]